MGLCALGLTAGLDTPVVTAPLRIVSLAVITTLLAIWWLARFRRPAEADQPSVIDGLAAFWLVAIAIAWLANGLENRRSSIGAWYEALALLLLLLLADLIRRGMPRRWLIDGLLLTGAVWMAMGVIEFIVWLANWLQTSGSGLPFLPVRPLGLLGNPNSFATGLLALLFLSVARLTGPKRTIVRIGWLGYAALALALLFLTQSRGGWFGAAAGIAAGSVLLFRFSRWRLTPRQIGALMAILIVMGSLLAIFVIPALFRVTGRGDNRPDIYRIAIQSFLQQPLTGHGPNSFGLQLLENQSIPPQPAHLHAHDLPLHVAAELGLPGLLALLATLLISIRLYWQHWTTATAAERSLLFGLGTACIAIAAHSLFDVIATQPSLFLMDVGLLAAAITPVAIQQKRIAITPSPRHRAGRMAVTLLATALTLFVIVAGWQGEIAYWPYWSAVQMVNSGAPFPTGWLAARPLLEEAASHDTQSPVTQAAAGYADGLLSARKADPDLRQRAIGYYEQALTVEPPNAINWLNLALLYSQAGRSEDAIRAARQSIRYGADDPLLVLNSGLIFEQCGQFDEARATYRAVLMAVPDWAVQPIWQSSALRHTVAEQIAATPPDAQQLLTRINTGQLQAARDQIAENYANDRLGAQPYIDQALLLIRTHGDLTLASHDLNAARMVFDPFQDWAWFFTVRAELDAAQENHLQYDRDTALIAADPSIAPDGITLPGGNGPTVAYFMIDLPRTLLPAAWHLVSVVGSSVPAELVF